ncbi:MAG TPA: DivIVA domain-containing protein [Candidatus Aminicenantes bacterium]|nr:DivIVA domain-containing protein [Candidatus Aminicenantes bacterium]
MNVSPQDIQNQSFSTRLRGLDPDEVRSFLATVAESMEAEITEKEDLKMKLERMRESLSKLEKREDVLRDTLIAAQKFSSEIKVTAHREAEIILKEAEVRAEELMKRAVERQRTVREEIKALTLRRREIENDMVHLLNSLREVIETYRQEDQEFEKIEFIGS